MEAGPDDQPPSLSVCPVTGGNVWKRRQDSSGEPVLSLLMTNLRTADKMPLRQDSTPLPKQPPTSGLFHGRSHVDYLISHDLTTILKDYKPPIPVVVIKF